MPGIVTNSFNVYNALNFKSSLSRTTPAPDVVYMFIGREDGWDGFVDSNGDPAIPVPSDTVEVDYAARMAAIALKKVSASDVATVIPRTDWITGTVYDQYDSSDQDMFEKTFYVLTTDLYVYKCINNNNGGLSTVQPTGTSTTIITTGDGYEWKFMYSIPSFLVQKFLTSGWMPVPTGTERDSFQIATETAANFITPDSNNTGSPIGGHGKSAVEELNGRYVMLYGAFEYDENGTIPINISYHQIGLWKNPLNISGTVLNGNVYATDHSSNDIVDKDSGRIIYIENRSEVSRSEDQTEKYRIILKF